MKKQREHSERIQWEMQGFLGIRGTGLHYCLKIIGMAFGVGEDKVPAGTTDIIISTWPLLDFSDIPLVFFPRFL